MDDAELLELGRVGAARPCSEDWAGMTGDARARGCSRCGSTVYDLSTVTTLEARELTRSNDGQVCVRFFRRADGTVLTRDCPVGVAAARRRRALAGLALGLSAAGALAVLAPTVHDPVSDAPAVQAAPSPTPPGRPVVAPAPPAAPPRADDETWMEQRRGRFELEHPITRRHVFIPIRGTDSSESSGKR